MTDLFADLPTQRRQEAARGRPAAYAFPHPRPATPRLLTDGERACACGLAATCGVGTVWTCPWCAVDYWPAGRGA